MHFLHMKMILMGPEMQNFKSDHIVWFADNLKHLCIDYMSLYDEAQMGEGGPRDGRVPPPPGASWVSLTRTPQGGHSRGTVMLHECHHYLISYS